MSNTNGEERLLYFADKVMSLCNREDLKRFDGFFPLSPEIYDDDEYGIFMDVTTASLRETVNVAIYTPGQPDGVGAKKVDQLCRLKALTFEQFRKKTGAFCIKPYHLEVAYADCKKIADGFLQEVNKHKPLRYVEIGGFETTPAGKAQALYNAQILLGVQFNLENQNYVYLRPDGAEIGFKYPLNNLHQVKELFSLRDIPDGNKRRSALRHWVAKHARRKPSKPDELIEVKKYIRGKENFTWFGINGHIYVNA